MTTELEQRLRDGLHEDAQRARLVNPHEPPAPEAQLLSEGLAPRRPGRKLVAVAAAIVLIAAAGVAVTQDRERDPDVTTEDPVAEVFTDLAPGDAEVFTEVPPGSTVELPPAPIGERSSPATVWTGTEMIVWGGMDADQATLDDGAAFDLATGTWRVIAPAPIEPRLYPAVAWTGTEMLVWGGQRSYSVSGAAVQTNPLRDGAAYNPATDTWRRLSDDPFDSWRFESASVWTGEELILTGMEPDPRVGSHVRMAAYNPATDEWRQLADPPRGFDLFNVLWTGEVILMTVPGVDPTTGDESNLELVRYDLSRDRWQPVGELVHDLVSYTDTGGSLVVIPELIAITDADGVARAVLVEPARTGAPIVVLDRRGNEIGTLPGLPADPAKFDDLSATGGVWAGEDVLFHMSAIDSEGTFGTTENWALNPATQTWRPFDADTAPPAFGAQLVADSGVFIGWGPLSPKPDDVGPVTGLVYRPPTPAGE